MTFTIAVVQLPFCADFVFFAVTQRVTPQSPPPPPKPPSPSFELGLSSFPPLPGAAGQLKTDDAFDNRLASSVVVGTVKERVRADFNIQLTHRVSLCIFYIEKNTCTVGVRVHFSIQVNGKDIS